MSKILCVIGAALLPPSLVVAVALVFYGVGYAITTLIGQSASASDCVAVGFFGVLAAFAVVGGGAAWISASQELYEHCRNWWEERND